MWSSIPGIAMTFVKKALILGTTAAFGGGLAISAAALASATINGAGATFPAPFMSAHDSQHFLVWLL